MKKGLFTLLMAFVALFVVDMSAQTSRKAKVPVQKDAASESLRWTQCRPLSLINGFKTSMPFKVSRKGALGRFFAKSVGDGTMINGNVIAANNWTEDNLHYGVYSFNAKGDFTVDPVIEKAELNSPMAVYAKGKYYTFGYQEFWGMLLEVSCTIFNTETWERENVSSNEAVWNNIPVSSAMAYDATTDNVYAVTYNADLTGYYLSIMDQENGTFTRISDLSRAFITLAVAPDGILYGISEEGVLYKLGKDGTETFIGVTGLTPKYSQSMICDPITGKLYWAFINDQESALYEINTLTGTAYKIDDMPHFEEIVGMFIEAPAFSDKVPEAVTDLKFTPSLEGSLNGIVSCVAPTENKKGENLSGTVKVTIYSGMEKILEQDVTPGTTIRKNNYTFDANKLYTLYAVASNSEGESPKQSITIYVGKDVASAPSNVTLSIQEKQATLTWTAPRIGLQDGYIDPTQVSYKIVRHMGDDEGTFVTTTAAGVTTCSDIVPNATAKYSYAVTAMYDNKEGGTAISNKVLSVGAYELPFYDDFSDGDLSTSLYTFLDLDEDGYDNQSEWFWKEDEKLMQFCADNVHVGNDWLITPAIHLDGKNLYDLNFNINMGKPSNLRVTIGTSTDPKDHTTILDLNNINDTYKTNHSTVLKASEGIYYIGFYAYSGLESFYMNLFDIKLEAGVSSEIPDSIYNLKIVPAEKGEASAKISFNAPKTLVNGTPIPSSFKVNVYRNDELAKEFSVTQGQIVDWTDEKPVLGSSTYRFVAVLGELEGFANSKTVWIGPDISEPVKDATAKTIDGNMHVLLTWKAPEKGANGGYFNINDITYSIWRSNDGKEYTQLEKNLKVLTYTDVEIEKELNGKQDSYYYAVTADSKSGVSEADAKFIVVGTPYKLPAWESFPNGQFHIYPWTTEPIEGSFSWECLRDDRDAEVYPQDNDKGFIKFYNTWSEKADSRLKTPVLDLSGSKNPSFSFFMFHWKNEDVEADGGKTKISIEISVDGGAFKQIGEDITAGYERDGWVEHRISLAEYKNAKQVQFGLRGYTDNTWMYYYVDNIRIEEQEDNDLAVTGFYGTESGNINDECVYTLQYFNRGLKVASGYKIELYQDDQLVQSLNGEDIQPNEIKIVDLKTLLSAAKAGQESVFYAKIVYDKDGNTDNNQSPFVNTTIKESWYPVVEDLKGTAKGNEITLSWTAPIIPTTPTETLDGVEDYEPFAINNIGNWVTYDGDQSGAGTIIGLPDYPNREKNQAFQVWAFGYLDGASAEDYPYLQPRTGDQCFISWYANVHYIGESAFNDDYLISPEVLGGTKVGFYIHRIDEDADEEYYQVMYSTTTQDPEEFKVLQEGAATYDWEKVEVTLPTDARYFAIHYIAEDQYGILIDDISYTSAVFALKVRGFNVFRDGQKINNELLTEPMFKDAGVSVGKHNYQVSVVYDRGESNASEAIEVTAGTGINDIRAGANVFVENTRIAVITESIQPVYIYTVDGKCIASDVVKNKTYFSVEKGIYIVKVGEMVTKVVVGE